MIYCFSYYKMIKIRKADLIFIIHALSILLKCLSFKLFKYFGIHFIYYGNICISLKEFWPIKIPYFSGPLG